MNVRYILFYLVFFIPSAIIILSIWYFIVDGTLYYCSDKIPLFDFIPPFVHIGKGDYFIAPPIIVYTVWIVFVVVGFIIPLLLTKMVMREVEAQISQKFRKSEKRE